MVRTDVRTQPAHPADARSGFLLSLLQAACHTRIDLLQFTLDLLGASFGIAHQIVGVRQRPVQVGLLLVGEVITNVAAFMKDAPLHQ